MPKKKRKRGPEAERVVIEGDWRSAIAKAVRVERPLDGWPEPQAPKKRTKKKP
jgi:hypothetical protein